MKRWFSVLVIVMAVVFFTMSGTTAAWAAGIATWKIIPNPTPDSSTNSSFRSIAAVSSKDVWAVGYYFDSQTQTYRTLIEHWNGTKWKIISSPHPRNNTFNAVAADAANDGWAVGSTNTGASLTEHWNGTTWSIIPSPNPTGATRSSFLGVTALSPSNAWAVGIYYDTSGDQLNLIEHWNGHQWSVVASPNRASSANALYSVTAVSATNIWASGLTRSSMTQSLTLVEHWNGTKWSIVASPNGGKFDNFLHGITAASATDIWAVGSYSPVGGELPSGKTLVEHWNGTKWSIVPSPNVGTDTNFLIGGTIVSTKDVWAVGDTLSDRTRALIEHWNGTEWSIVASPTGSSESSLNGVAHVPGTTTAWTAGDIFRNNGRFTLTAFHG
jgi:hypothetical protein